MTFTKALIAKKIADDCGFMGCRYFLSGVMRHAVVLDPGSRESLYPRCRRGVASPIFVYISRRDPSRC